MEADKRQKPPRDAAQDGSGRAARQPVVTPGHVAAGDIDMPPTARRLLEAARRILEKKGYSALTYRAIATEAGESATPINRYFGGKDGLVLVLMEWLFQDVSRELYLGLSGMAQGRLEKRNAYFTRVVTDTPAWGLYLELFVHTWRKPDMRPKLADVMSGYRRLNTWWFSPSGSAEVGPELADLAALTVAVTDGLAMQLLADPESVDAERALQLWADFIDWKMSGEKVAGEGSVE